MTFRATNIIPEQGFSKAKSLCERLKRFCDSRSSEFSSNTPSNRILDALMTLMAFRTQLDIIKTTPGISQYAQDQEGDPSYDVAAEFTAVLALLDTATQGIISTFPKDGSGYILAETMNSDGILSPRNFTPSSLSALRSNLDAVSNGIS